jgi:enoyl-CoA hydratase/carnithine racemase
MDAYLTNHGSWAELVLNRPDRKNAITGPLGQALTACLEEASSDAALQVILLRGEGGAFCSGLDLKHFNADPPPDWLPDFQQIWRGAHRALFDCNKPIIGALEGYAINGGAALALACDLLIAGDGAFLQVGEIQLGMAAPYNMAWLSLRHPEAVAARLALVGRRYTGQELVDMGVATESVADELVLDRARSLSEEMASYPPDAGRRIKSGIRASLGADADSWFDRFTGTVKNASRPPGKVS